MSNSNIRHWQLQTSPLEPLYDPVFREAGISVLIKRDDLLIPYGGNKWRKLKYNFMEMTKSSIQEFVTFGGPFSNHIYASASMAKLYGFSATIYVRGAVDDLENPVLDYVRKCGVNLIGLDRSEYSNRYSKKFQQELRITHPDALILNEGGAGENGLRGCSEIVPETIEQFGFRPDVWVTPVGTGNTASGIASQLCASEKVFGISALRLPILMQAYELSTQLISLEKRENIDLVGEYAFGGMAKWNEKLISFMNQFESRHGILLDPIYTGKAMYGLYDIAAKGTWARGSTIVFVHTGGMPGRMSFNYRFPNLLSLPFPLKPNQ